MTAVLRLAGLVTGPVTGRFGLGADVRSLTGEGIFTYRVANDEAKGTFVDVLAGARYMKNRGGLSLGRDGEEIAGTEQTLDWVDARRRLRLGLQLECPGRLRGEARRALQDRRRLSLLDVDCDKGDGLGRRIWQVAYQGPYAFIGYAW